MSKWLVSRARDYADAPLFQCACAGRHLGRRDPKGKLQRQHTYRRRGIVKNGAALRECEDIGTNPEFHASWPELLVEWKAERHAVERAHRLHLARENHGVVEITDR